MRGLIGVALLLAACQARPAPGAAVHGKRQAYGYVMLDTTGLDEGIVLDPGVPGERRAPDVNVKLRGGSAMLASLRALRWETMHRFSRGT